MKYFANLDQDDKIISISTKSGEIEISKKEYEKLCCFNGATFLRDGQLLFQEKTQEEMDQEYEAFEEQEQEIQSQIYQVKLKNLATMLTDLGVTNETIESTLNQN